jgi:DNA polymerase I-like protein with 3'-5' exonuclease and polymerase domains
MIKVYERTTDDVGALAKFSREEFLQWLPVQESFQFDVETNVTPYWSTKKLMTMQFGAISKDIQFVFQWKHIVDDPELLALIKEKLESWEIEKVIHNAAFEYIICRFHEIEIHRVFCTMLAEKVINGGLENADYSLADISEKYCGVILDKTYQTAFGDGLLTYGKAVYAADDVKYLGSIKSQQLEELQKWNLLEVMDLENKACLAFSDMTYYGMQPNVEKWKKNIALAEPVIEAAKNVLDHWLRHDPAIRKKAVELGFLKLEDSINFNLNSPAVKLRLLQLEFPDLSGATKIFIQKYIRDNASKLSVEQLGALVALTSKNFKPMEWLLLSKHREWLTTNYYITKNGDKEEKNLYVFPAGAVDINWNSQTQTLPLLRMVEPKLKDLSAESFGKTSHPIIADVEQYKDSLKLVSSFGEKFLTLIEPDGFVRTNFNQIVSTGRPSSSKPNMNQIPAKEAFTDLGNRLVAEGVFPKVSDFYLRYRNAFEFKEFWFVDSDFVGQELAIIAHIAKDEVWFEAITNNLDLHSMVAEKVFKDKWKNAADDNCEYYRTKQKCKCSGHKTLRNSVKTLNFGLAYGMSQFKLAATLKCTVKEAEKIMEDYFNSFPKIKQVLDYLGRFGVEKGYIQTLAPFFRKRRFPTWHYSKSNIQSHISGVQYDSNLGSIERASKNQPKMYGLFKLGEFGGTLSVRLRRQYRAEHHGKEVVKV